MAFVPVYILILGFTIVVDYFAGIYIAGARGVKRKLFLTMSLVANIGILAIFKYYNFISGNLTALLQSLGWQHSLPLLTILLPIGLSFHTFQAMSYTIEVYRGNQKPERNFGIYALYVMFYPQLVAGPIERPQNILYQFYEKHNFDWAKVNSGFKRIIWGFFKKLVIADRASLYVDAIYSHADRNSSTSLIVATVFFAIQIYCDFSGYSDIAIGTAEIMGFDLIENFRRPYFSKTVSEFWRRWHISLSTWFTDYLYISMGGNRVSVPRYYFNLLFVFLISGLWHGANWTFVVWGGINGLYLIFAVMTRGSKKSANSSPRFGKLNWLYSLMQIVTTFVLICFSWIFFRADSIKDAIFIIKKILTFKGALLIKEDIFDLLIGVAILFCSEFLIEYYPNHKLFTKSKYTTVRCLSYTLLVIVILMIGVFDGGQFIYFQF